MLGQKTVLIILMTVFLMGCNRAPMEMVSTPTPVATNNPPVTNTALPQATSTPKGKPYEFPEIIDPSRSYLFYLHGRIIEDQGIPAISPEFGEYEYEAILKTLESYGFVVISEQRPKDTDGVEYARKLTEQVKTLLNAGVPAKKITVVGASKGAGITIFVSHYLENKEINFVIMGICHPDEVQALKQNQISLYGNVLSIYDSVDNYAGSCQKLFSFSDGKGISRYEEVVLHIGTGHGILYQPLDEWILPAVEWAEKNMQ